MIHSSDIVYTIPRFKVSSRAQGECMYRNRLIYQNIEDECKDNYDAIQNNLHRVLFACPVACLLRQGER